MLAIEVIGNLGNDAEVKQFNGAEFLSFSVADSQKVKDANGNQIERTTWVSCTMQGNGGALTQYLKKGTPVFIRGDLRISTYRRNDGNVAVNLNVRVRNINLLPSRRDNGQATGAPGAMPGSNDDAPF